MSWQRRAEIVSLLEVLAEEERRVAGRLARMRESMALTQEKAASRAGVTLRQWQRWESGQSEPRASNLLKISEEFGVPLSDLLEVESNAADAAHADQLDRIEWRLKQLSEQVEEVRLHLSRNVLEVMKRFDEVQTLSQDAPRKRRAG